jgi:hypothetical protein
MICGVGASSAHFVVVMGAGGVPMLCLQEKVPQMFAAGGNWSYLELWVITGGLRYPGYKTVTVLVFIVACGMMTSCVVGFVAVGSYKENGCATPQRMIVVVASTSLLVLHL